jgi:hypothetical protein
MIQPTSLSSQGSEDREAQVNSLKTEIRTGQLLKSGYPESQAFIGGLRFVYCISLLGLL